MARHGARSHSRSVAKDSSAVAAPSCLRLRGKSSASVVPVTVRFGALSEEGCAALRAAFAHELGQPVPSSPNRPNDFEVLFRMSDRAPVKQKGYLFQQVASATAREWWLNLRDGNQLGSHSPAGRRDVQDPPRDSACFQLRPYRRPLRLLSHRAPPRGR